MIWLARWAAHRPRLTLLLLALAVALGAGQLFRLQVRTDGEALYALGSPTVAHTVADRERFGQAELLILLLTARPEGPAVETAEGFAALRRLHGELRELPALDGDRIRSLADLLQPPRHRDWLHVRAFFDDPWDTPEALAAVAAAIHRHPLAEGLFLSADGEAAAFYLPVAAGVPRREAVDQVERWIGTRRGGAFDLRLTGPAVAEAVLGETVLTDLARLVPLMVAVVAVLLFVSLRTLGGVIVPMAEVAAVLVVTLGTMAAFGVPVTLVTTILPVVLMAATITDEIQALARFQAQIASAPPEEARSASFRARAIVEVFRAIGPPVVLTSIATALGFASFLSSSIVPMRHFGLFNAFGMLVEMVLTFLIVPALAVLLPTSWFRPLLRSGARRAGEAAPSLEARATRRTGKALAAALAAAALFAPGLARLEVQDSWVDNFDPDFPLVSAERDYNRAFWGSYRFDVVFASAEPGYFQQPAGLALLERFGGAARKAPAVRGLVDHLVPHRIIATAWGEAGEPSALPAPIRERIAGWIHVIRGRIDYHQFVTEDGREARACLLVNRPDYRLGRDLWRHLERRLPALIGSEEVDVHFSGDLPLAVDAVGSIVGSQMRSIGWTVLGIALLLVPAFRSLARTAVVLAPVGVAALSIFGAMGYAGLPLGVATSMFAPLGIGVGVTFGIYFTHEYLRQRGAGKTVAEANLATVQVTGRAIRWNALALALGFIVLVFSGLKPNHSLGLLLAGSMVACYAATVLMLPYLVRWVVPRAGARH